VAAARDGVGKEMTVNPEFVRLAAAEYVKSFETQLHSLSYMAELMTHPDYVSKFPAGMQDSVQQLGELTQDIALRMLNVDNAYSAMYRLSQSAQTDTASTIAALQVSVWVAKKLD
jgi:hypothetical protein